MLGTYLRKIKLYSKKDYAGSLMINKNYNASYNIDNLSITLNKLSADKIKVNIFEHIGEVREDIDVSGGSFFYSLILKFITAEIKSMNINFNGLIFSIDRISFENNCLAIKNILFKENIILKDLHFDLSRNLILIRKINFHIKNNEIHEILKFLFSFPPSLKKDQEKINYKIEIDQLFFAILDKNFNFYAKNILIFNNFARIFQFNFNFKNLNFCCEKFLLNKKFKIKKISLQEGEKFYISKVDETLNIYFEDELFYRLIDIFEIFSDFLIYLPKQQRGYNKNNLYVQGGILYEDDYLFSEETKIEMENNEIFKKLFIPFKKIILRRKNKETILTEKILKERSFNLLDMIIYSKEKIFIDLSTEVNFLTNLILYFLKKKINFAFPENEGSGEKINLLCKIKLHNFLCTYENDKIFLLKNDKIYAKLNLSNNYAKILINKEIIRDLLSIMPYEKVKLILNELGEGDEKVKLILNELGEGDEKVKLILNELGEGDEKVKKEMKKFNFKITVEKFGTVLGNYIDDHIYARINNDSTQICIKEKKLFYFKLGIQEVFKSFIFLDYLPLINQYIGESKGSGEFDILAIKNIYNAMRENIHAHCKFNFLNLKINFLHDEIIFDGWVSGNIELRDKIYADLYIRMNMYEMGLISSAKDQYMAIIEKTDNTENIKKPSDDILNLLDAKIKFQLKVAKNEIFLCNLGYANKITNMTILKYNDLRSTYDIFLEEINLPFNILFNFLNTGILDLDIIHLNLPDNSKARKIQFYATGDKSDYSVLKGGNQNFKNQLLSNRVERIKKIFNFQYDDNMFINTKEGNFPINIFKTINIVGRRIFFMQNNKLIYAHKLFIKNNTVYELIINGNSKIKAKNIYTTNELFFTIGTYKFSITTLFDEKSLYIRPIEYTKNIFLTLIFTEKENHFTIDINPSIQIINYLSLGCFTNRRNECIVCTNKSCNSVTYYNLDNNLYICDYAEKINFYKNKGLQIDIENSIDLNLFHLNLKSNSTSSIYSSNRLNNLILYRFTKERILEIQWKAFLICDRKILENNILYIDDQKITKCKNIYNLSNEYTQVSTLNIKTRINGELLNIELGDQPVEFKNILFERMYRKNTFILKISESNYKEDITITNIFKINIKRVVVHIFSYIYELDMKRQNAYIDEQMSISLFNSKIELSLFSNGDINFAMVYKICQVDNHRAMTTLFKSTDGFFSLQLIRVKNLELQENKKIQKSRLQKALKNILPNNEYILKPDLLSISLNEAVLYLSALSSGESTNYNFSFLIFPFKLTVYKAGIKIPILFNKIFLNESDSNYLSQLIEKQVYKKIGSSIFKSLPSNFNKGTVKTLEGIKKGFYGLTKSFTDQMNISSVNINENILFSSDDIFNKMTKNNILKMHKLTIDKHNRFLSPLYNDDPNEERRRSTYPKFILTPYKEERHKAFYYFLLRNKMFKNKKYSLIEFYNTNSNSVILSTYVDSCLIYFDSRYYYCIICTKYIYLVDHGIIYIKNITVGNHLITINEKEIFVTERILKIIKELK